MNQILLQEWNTPFHAFPFDQIRQEDYEPAIHHLLHEAKAEIQAIAQNQESPSFSNTIEALEKAGLQLNRVVEAFFNINSAETNGYIQETAQKLAPQLAAYSNDMLLNRDLFHRVKEVYDHRHAQDLSPEQSRLLE
ncbi:MAG: dipeptidyl carboxypeptidase II, partial [Taibaiella sp.]|nr:dipeptidyl carboxypeptidase II [Taibaiella sp.]